MDKSLRTTIYNTVVQCRHLLERDMARQLEGTYGVHTGGTFEPLESLAYLDAVGRADRGAIETAICHEEAVGAGRREAVERYVRESAFTFLNRLAALKLMEHPDRALIQPSVGAGDQSKGFQQFSLISLEAMRAQPDGGYRLYLELLFDDLSQTLGVLFDRTLPTSILFPTQPCLQEVLDLLNDPALEAVWAEDETIGWIYQYFTPTELREEARKASSAPRNSYELAFRNQFYTPRYVVAFLADNTLGRLWWEMRGGETRLVEQCPYLIRAEFATEPQRTQREDEKGLRDLCASVMYNCSQSSMHALRMKKVSDLCASVAKRDPRELRILDPAGGSGHFLLYCFDLLLTIYDEAYDDPDLGPGLQRDFPDREGFRRAVPRLILERNLHGIDIDLRAVQIAGFALWLRAQRAWAEMGLKMRQRPRVARVNVVCAEPMPGEYDLLGEFTRDLKPAVLGNLVRDVWEKMRLAGEAGSLLKIEQEIRDSVRKARETLAGMPPAIQLTLFGPLSATESQRTQREGEGEGTLSVSVASLDRRELEDTTFWNNAEARVVEALRAYARRAGNGRRVSRRLFADDALQGIAFVDLLQRPFDVALMNPPFGASSVGSKEYIKDAYPRTKNDLYAAFVERGLELLRPGGLLGAITSRTGFFLTSFRKWREEILLEEARLVALADLGYGVLDTAMVETAAYVLRKLGIDK